MKRFILSLLIVAGFVFGKAEVVNLGYCGGEVATQGSVSVNGKTWVDGAIYLPAEMLESYKGGKIKALRVGLATKINVDSVRAWIRTSLDGPNERESLMTLKSETTFKKGWNEFAIDEDYEITSEGLYIGYSYHQKGASGVFSVVGSPLKNAFFAKLGAEAEWAEMADAGILSVEAVVESDMMPEYDLAITSAQAAINTDGRYDVALSVINNGKNEISGFAITACYEGETPCEYHFDGPLASMEKKDYRFVIPVSNTAMTVSLKALDNGADEIAGNNSVQAKIALVKKVLIEEFTTELCSNCPDAAASLHEVLESEAYKNRAVAVCHHAGFYTDFLTKPCDSELVSLYSIGYAPAMMYDRYPMFSGVVHGFTGTVESIKASIDKRISEEACYALGFDVKYDEDTKVVKVNVSVERQKSSSSLPQRLLVWLTEDEVLSQNQRGATGNFKHKHVIREYNNTFGENIEWNGTRFSKDYEFTVDKEWKLGNLNIVASVADHDSENPNNRIVVNTELLSLRFLDKSGVEAIDDDSPAKSVEYYNLNGCKTTETAPKGIYIKKTVYESGRTSVEKVVNLTGGM